jgi:Flp pilus assembly protein TadG
MVFKSNTCRNGRRLRRRGAALVEFALVLPVLLLTLLGILELGRVLQVQQVLTNAAREGARHGAADAPPAQVEQIVRRYLKNQGLTAVEPQASVTNVTNETTPSGFPIYRVRVTLPASAVSWISTPYYLGASSQLVADSSWTRN